MAKNYQKNLVENGSRGGAYEQIVPEIYTRVFEVVMRYRYPNRVSNLIDVKKGLD